MLKKSCVVLLSVVGAFFCLLPVGAVLGGELELDGSRGESAIWNASHYLSFQEAEITPVPGGIEYGELSYLIDENQKRLFLYVRYCDEASGGSRDRSGFHLLFSDGCRIFLSAAGLYTGAPCAQVQYCARVLRDREVLLEAQIDFHTVSEAKKALEGLEACFSDRTGSQTASYSFKPVFPVPPEAETEPPGEETEATKPQTTKKETTRKETTTKATTTRKSSAQGKTSSAKGKTTSPDQEESLSAAGRTFDYTVTGAEDSRYRTMIVLVVLLIVLLIMAIAGSFLWPRLRTGKRGTAHGERSAPEGEENGAADEPHDPEAK